ncbi:MAG TPA: hypothetical protein VF708_21145 [Pyrinomonadaceae bacterium]|jgi:hypothetical protein
MNSPALRRAFIAFHLTLGVVVFAQSLITVSGAFVAGGARHSNYALALFAGAEVLAALLFLWPATLRVGGCALLLIFAAAMAFHGLHGELQSTLLVYTAGVVLVMVHGSAFGKGSLRQSSAAT